MTCVRMAGLIVAIGQVVAAAEPASPAATAADLRADVRTALKGTRRSQPALRDVDALIDVYQRLNYDRTLAEKERDRLGNAVRARLRIAHSQLTRSKKVPTRRETHLYAQRVPAARAVLLDQTAAKSDEAGGAEKLAALIEDVVAPASWEKAGGPGRIRAFGLPVAAQRQAFPQQLGPQRPLPPFGQAPMQVQADDAGEDLAKLIEDVIAPDSWESRGGPGVIRYWGPGKSLVVRQTPEAHEGVINLLEQLRR